MSMKVTVVYTIDPLGLNENTVRNIIEGQRSDEIKGVGGLTIEIEDAKVVRIESDGTDEDVLDGEVVK